MSGCSFIDKAIDEIKQKKTVNIFSNVKRCFVKVEALIFVYEKLINSENYGTYNIAGPLVSYYDRLENLCQEKKINFDKLITKIKGSTFHLEKKINSQKFEKSFTYKIKSISKIQYFISTFIGDSLYDLSDALSKRVSFFDNLNVFFHGSLVNNYMSLNYTFKYLYY